MIVKKGWDCHQRVSITIPWKGDHYDGADDDDNDDDYDDNDHNDDDVEADDYFYAQPQQLLP